MRAEIVSGDTTFADTTGIPVITKGNALTGVVVSVTEVVPPTPSPSPTASPSPSPSPTPSPSPSAAPTTPPDTGSGGINWLLILVIILAIVLVAVLIGWYRSQHPPEGPSGDAGVLPPTKPPANPPPGAGTGAATAGPGAAGAAAVAGAAGVAAAGTAAGNDVASADADEDLATHEAVAEGDAGATGAAAAAGAATAAEAVAAPDADATAAAAAEAAESTDAVEAQAAEAGTMKSDAAMAEGAAAEAGGGAPADPARRVAEPAATLSRTVRPRLARPVLRSVPEDRARVPAALDTSLGPRAPSLLYDLVGSLGLAAESVVLDAGCGEGGHTIELARRFPFVLTGLDPVARHIEIATERLAAVRISEPEVAGRVGFMLGRIEALPLGDGSVDLVWCRDVLVHIADLETAFGEFRRVLRPMGRVLLFNMFGTDRLEPREAEWLWRTMGVVPASADPTHVEAAIKAAGLRIDDRIDLGSEFAESAAEGSDGGARWLLGAARLLRDPERYIGRFGKSAYEIMLGDCLWHIYQMLGKLAPRVYVLSNA